MDAVDEIKLIRRQVEVEVAQVAVKSLGQMTADGEREEVVGQRKTYAANIVRRMLGLYDAVTSDEYQLACLKVTGL